MLVHTVFFWLRKDLDDAQISKFRMGLESLIGIEHAESVFVREPASVAERPVCDGSYDFCLTVILKDVSRTRRLPSARETPGLHRYHKDKWEKVKVYDAD
jgi:hypothetical protein